MLKVLYLPLNDQNSVQQATYDAFHEVGVNLEICDFYNVWLRTKNLKAVTDDFLNKVKSFQPNLIHMQLQFTGLIRPEIIRQARELCPNVVITNWSGDIRNKAIPDFVEVASVLDYALISSTGQLEMYKNAGCSNIRYWQIGYDPKVLYPLNKKNFKFDVSFIANHYGDTFPDGKIRHSVGLSLKKEFGSRFGLFGSGWEGGVTTVEPKKMNEVYNDSICSLSISNFNSVSHYFSDRLLYCVAAGRPTIAWRFPGCDDYFIEGKEIFYAQSLEEIINIINFCKNNPDVATAVGVAGSKRVLKEHTFVSRIIELLQLTKLIHLV